MAWMLGAAVKHTPDAKSPHHHEPISITQMSMEETS
jgi:hypothetical protein